VSFCGRRSLVEILLVALGLRLLVFGVALARSTSPETFYLEDTSQYIEAATALLEHGEFSREGGPDILRTPGYPLMLLPGLALGHVVGVTIAWQIALSCATVYLVYRLALLLGLSDSCAKLAALLYACEPFSILFCSKLMTETLFAFVLVVFLYCLVAYFADSRWRWLLVGAAALGEAILIRPVAYYLPLVVGAALLIRALSAGQPRWTRCLQAAALIGLALAPALAWQLRNHVVAHYDRYSKIEDMNLYFYNAAAVLARQRGITVDAQNTEMGYHGWPDYVKAHPEQADWTQVERLKYMRREGMRILRANPGQYLVIHVEGLVPLLLGGGATETIQLLGLNRQAQLQDEADRQFNGVIGYAYRLLTDNFGLFCCNVILSTIAVAFLAAGAVGAFNRATFARLPLFFLFCIGTYFILVAGGPTGRPRYRHHVMPIVCLFAAEGARRLTAGCKKNPGKATSAPGVTDGRQLVAA
jgi:4-amino-4-deoxy-L-arabinose transferase-like glycosyltransferase